jgi:di/tricarboxylate transporter
MNTGIVVVLGLIAIVLVLFVTELIPVDVTAIGLMVGLILLEPWTKVGPSEGVQGFSNPATLTVLAMFMLSEGVRRTGVVQILIRWLESFTGDSEGRSLFALFALAGPPSGFVNNTPVVAILIPVARKLARNVRVSPSRLMMPLSFISMLGGTLTLIGTSSTIIASDLSLRLIGQPISMFEFTHLGVILMLVGGLYMFTIGWQLIPDRVKSDENLVQEFEMEDYLTDVEVLDGSEFVGQTVREMIHGDTFDVDVSQVIRDGRSIRGNIDQITIQPGDVLVVRASRDTLNQFIESVHLEIHGKEDVLPEHIKEEAQPVETESAESVEDGLTLAEVVLLPTCPIVGQSVRQAGFRDRFHGTVLAIRRGGEVIRERMKNLELKAGDTLLVQTGPTTVNRISNTQGFVVTGTEVLEESRTERIPHALLIMTAVVVLPALNLVPIMVSAFAGVVAMILSGCLRMREAYEAVSWDIIFLLAGVIPLGLAMEKTGTDRIIADLILQSAPYLPSWGMLFLLYVITVSLTNLISNAAAVILMLPIAVTVAQSIGASAFSFVMLVTLGSATAFISPIGYQTNLMVYGPGGYKFTDFARVGLGLQVITGVILTIGALVFW